MELSKYVCPHCNKEFAHWRTLRKHEFNAKYCLMNRKDSFFECQCGKRYGSKLYLDGHQNKCDIYQLKIANIKLEEAVTKIEEYEKKLNEIETKLEKKAENFKKNQLVLDCEHSLSLNGTIVICRASDGYVNLTHICKAGNKIINNWNRNDKTQAFLKALSIETRLRVSDLLQIQKGGDVKSQGTWGHPQVAINLAQWISPEFNVLVSKWVFELLIIGKLDLENQKTSSEIMQEFNNKLTIQKCQIDNLIEDNKKLKKKLGQFEKKHHYHKFSIDGPVVYLLDFGNSRLKIGKAGVGRMQKFNDRLASHRTDQSCLKVLFVIGSCAVHVENIEKQTLDRFDEYLESRPHEIFKDIEPEVIQTYIQTHLLDAWEEKYSYDFLSDDEIEKYNTDVDYTLKD